MNTLLIAEKNRHILLYFFIFLHIFFVGTNSSHALSESDKQNPTLLSYEGWKYLNKGGSQNFDKAQEYFQKAINLNRYHADAYVGLGKLDMERNRRPYTDYTKDQCRKGLALFEKAISLDDKFVPAYYFKAEALLCLENFDEALKTSDMIEEHGYDYYECRAHSTKSKAYKGKFLSKKDPADKKMAIVESTDYLKCAEKNPDSGNLPLAADLFRDIMRTTKDFDETEKYFKRNIKLKPHSMWSYHNYYNLVLLRTEQGYLKGTDISEVGRIIKDGKSNTGFDIGPVWEINFYRANVFFKRKVYDKALVEYTDYLAGNPNPIHESHRERMSFLCSQFTDGRCRKSWQKIIQSYLERGDCANAAKEFKVQYDKQPDAFEHLRNAVSQCKGEKQ